jgi:transcriptional regulator with XRE-family HTH domain
MNKIIGDNIRQYRKRLGYTQQDLSEFLKIKRSLVSYYENGKRNISISNLMQLGLLFGIDEVDLMEKDSINNQVTMFFLFPKETFNKEDFESICAFRKVVKNYLKMDEINRQE